MRPHSLVDSTPVEILHLIFGELNAEEASVFHAPQLMRTDLECPLPFPSPDRSFPYNIATVCKQWAAIVSDDPAYWQRLNIPVGAPELATLKHHLKLSKNRGLSIVIHNDIEDSDAEDSERHIVADVLRILQPHLPRCQELMMMLKNGSSLPLLQDLSRLSSRLRTLVLRCQRDDGSPQPVERRSNLPAVVEIPNSRIAQVAEPTAIYLSGHVVADTLQHWPRFLLSPRTQFLVLRHFDAARYESDVVESIILNLFEVLSATRYREGDEGYQEATEDGKPNWYSSYVLLNFNLEDYYLSPHLPLRILSTCFQLALRDLDGAAVQTFFDGLYVDREHVSITNCNIDGVRFIGTPRAIWGEGLSGDVVGLLEEWDCDELVLRNCSVDEKLFLALGEGSITDLRLVDCPNVTARDIIRLVEHREKLTDPLYRQIYFLNITVVHPAALEEKWAMWLAQRAVVFRWSQESISEQDIYEI